MAREAARAEGSTAYPGSTSEEHQKNLLIMGGWNPDTHRDDLLPDLRDLLSRIGVADQFSDIFTTGPRRGHAMGIVRWDSAVSEQDLKRKMIKPVQEIRGASVEQEHGPRQEPVGGTQQNQVGEVAIEPCRKNQAPHIGNQRIRKHAMFVELGAGSVWMRSIMIASATRPPPREAPVKQGRSPGSWIDIGQIGRLLGTSGEHLAERWEALISE
eukprot:s1667_g9.t1